MKFSIKIKDENQCIKVQKKLFSFGYRWAGTGKNIFEYYRCQKYIDCNDGIMTTCNTHEYKLINFSSKLKI